MDEDDLLGAVDNEVATWIDWALVEAFHFLLGFIGQDTLGAPKHDGQSADGNAPPPHNLLPPNIVEIYQDRRRVCTVSKPTFIRRDGRVPVDVDVFHSLFIDTAGFPNIYIRVPATQVSMCLLTIKPPSTEYELEEECRVDIAQHSLIRFDDLLKLDLDEKVERIDVLFDQTFDLKEGR